MQQISYLNHHKIAVKFYGRVDYFCRLQTYCKEKYLYDIITDLKKYIQPHLKYQSLLSGSDSGRVPKKYCIF